MGVGNMGTGWNTLNKKEREGGKDMREEEEKYFFFFIQGTRAGLENGVVKQNKQNSSTW